MDENNTNENNVNENDITEKETNNEVKEFIPQTTSEVYEQINEAATKPISAFEMSPENKTTVTTGTPVSSTSTYGSSQTNAYNSAGSYYTETTTSAPENFSTGFAIASLVLGILSILTSCCCGLGLILGILGIIFGCVQQKNPLDQKPTMAIVGIVLSVVGILATLAFLVYYYMVGSAL